MLPERELYQAIPEESGETGKHLGLLKVIAL